AELVALLAKPNSVGSLRRLCDRRPQAGVPLQKQRVRGKSAGVRHFARLAPIESGCVGVPQSNSISRSEVPQHWRRALGWASFSENSPSQASPHLNEVSEPNNGAQPHLQSEHPQYE